MRLLLRRLRYVIHYGFIRHCLRGHGPIRQTLHRARHVGTIATNVEMVRAQVPHLPLVQRSFNLLSIALEIVI